MESGAASAAPEMKGGKMNEPKTTRVIICGPPGSGKSSVLRMLETVYHEHKHEQVKVGFIPEAATNIMETIPILKTTVSDILFQSIVNLAITTSDKLLCQTLQDDATEILILSDRSLIDTFIYSDADFDKVGVEFTPPHYDFIVFCMGCYCGKAGNPQRLETENEYERVAERTMTVYREYAQKHEIPFVIVPVTGTIAEKTGLVADAINRHLQMDVFTL